MHIIKTNSLASDGRLLKWINSLEEQGISSEVFILEDNNSAGTTEQNDVKIVRTTLLSRRLFPKRKGYFFKVPEFAIQALRHIRKSDADTVIFHDLQHYLTLALLLIAKPKQKKIIWDLHELPHPVLLSNPFARQVLRFIMNRVDVIIHTNKHRKAYLLSKVGSVKATESTLHNYPLRSYISAGMNPLPEELLQWLGGTPYALWMGMASTKRNFLPFYQALRPYLGKIRLVIIGRIHKDVENLIKADEEFRFIYNKFVKHDEIVHYIDHAKFSAVFYKHTSANNYYCEPNRLYQLLSRGIPVIGGNNPQIATLIGETQGGILLKDDGTEVAGVKEAVSQIMDEHVLSTYRSNLSQFDFSHVYSWEEEFAVVQFVLFNQGSI